MTHESRMRRTPQQARGQRRVAQILDAAAEVFAEIGYEAATTNAIAIRANTSIGSLYQFFPNKHAILDALARRYESQLTQLLDIMFSGDDAPLQDALEALIDRIAEFYLAHPAFQAMFSASRDSGALSSIADSMCALIIVRVSDRFMTEVDALGPADAELYATIVVYTMRGLIPLGVSSGDVRQQQVIAHLKRTINAYLRSLEAFRDQEFSPGD